MGNVLTEKVATVVDLATKRALEREAKRVDRTVGAVVRIAIREYLKANGGKA